MHQRSSSSLEKPYSSTEGAADIIIPTNLFQIQSAYLTPLSLIDQLNRIDSPLIMIRLSITTVLFCYILVQWSCDVLYKRLYSMKGIHIQFEGITKFIDSILSKPEHQPMDVYLFNLEKITLETFTILNIVLNNAPQEVPFQVTETFTTTVSKFKEYFKRNPKADLENQEEEMFEFDEIQQFMQRRRDVSKNHDSQRGQLYKFLNETQEKQKNNSILLQNIPKFAYGKTAVNTKSSLIEALNQPIKVQVKTVQKTQQTYASDFAAAEIIAKQEGGSLPIYHFQGNSQGNEMEAQTQFSIEALKEYIQYYSAQVLVGKDEKEAKQMSKDIFECMHIGAQKVMKGHCPSKLTRKVTMKNIKSRKGLLTIEDQGDQELENKSKSTKKVEGQKEGQRKLQRKKSKNKERHSKQFSKISSENSLHPSKTNLTKTLITEQGIKKDKMTHKKRDSKRSSITDQLNPISKRDKQQIKKSSNFNKTGVFINEGTKGQKGGEHFENDKDLNNLQRNSVLQGVDIRKEEMQRSSVKEKANLKMQEIQRLRNEANYRFSEELHSENDRKSHWGHQSFIFQEQQGNIINNNNLTQQKHKKYSKTGDMSQILPSLDKTKIQANRQSSENLPYISKLSTHYNPLESGLKKKGKLSTYESFKMNSSQSGMMTKMSNLSTYNDTHNKFPLLRPEQGLKKELIEQYMNLSQNEKKQLLMRQEERVMNEIGQSSTSKKNKNVQWVKIIRNIRQYEALHLRTCDENCIHLKKFYDFLKKKNLSMYVNRKLLQVHKKNIEIGSQF